MALTVAYVINPGFVRVETCASITDALRAGTIDDVVWWQSPPYLGSNRQLICEHFMTSPADVLLMVDADMRFAPDDASTLLSAVTFATPIVGAVYANVRLTGRFVEVFDAAHHPVSAPDGLEAVGAVGSGMLAIHRSAFERMPHPWFTDGDNEDLRFCSAAWMVGVPVMAHGGVRVGHIKPVEFCVQGDSVITATTARVG